MSPTDDPTHTALLAVIQNLTATVDSVRKEAVEARKEAALIRKEARKELARLIAMIEGLTQQLDKLLGEHDVARRASLAAQRQEARRLAEQAAKKLADPEGQAQGDAHDASDEASGDPSSDPSNDGSTSEDEAGGTRDAHGRAAKPAHLPRDENKLRPKTCPQCGGTNLLVGKSLITEEYDYVRAHLRVRKTTRVICDCAECNAHIVPEQPPMPFDRAACTFSMMAWLCFAKCGLFLPLDRLMRDFADQGAPIPSPTLTRWSRRGADLLLPVAAAVRLSLLMQTHIRTDGTGLQVVFPRVKAKPTKGAERPGEVDADGYLVHRKPIRGQVLVFGDDEHAVYYFTEDKAAHHTEDFFLLGYDAQGHPIRWTGTVTADAINHYDKMFAGGEYTESGCNAHGLRKFRDDKDKAPLLASKAMKYIGGFYKVEAEAKRRDLTGVELLAHRQAHAGPIAQQFRVWLDDHIDNLLLPSHPIRKAMQYYINHWEALTHFLSDPLVHLDNNWSERALRKIALLRNNSLYASGIDGAQRLCTLFTLIGTCRALGVEPHGYLEWALTRVVPHTDNRGLRASDLTPAAYKAAQQA